MKQTNHSLIKAYHFIVKKSCIALLIIAAIPIQFSTAQSINQESWYMPIPEDQYSSLYVIEFGKGEPVLVLHGGFGAEHSYLIDLVSPLETQYRFILFDQRGSLRSPVPDSLLTFEGLVSDIESIRKELKINKLRLLGHSMGTRLAMAYAERYPAHVHSLTLVGAVLPKAEVPEGITSPEQLPPPKFVVAQPYLINRPVVQQLFERYNLLDDVGLNSKQRTLKWRIQFAAANLYDVTKFNKIEGGGAFYNAKTGQLISQSAGEMYNYVPSLKRNNIPVTVINGDHDFTDFTALSYGELLKIMNPSMNETPAEWMPGWTYYKNELPLLHHYIIPKAGHAPWIDSEKQTIEALKKSLDR